MSTSFKKFTKMLNFELRNSRFSKSFLINNFLIVFLLNIGIFQLQITFGNTQLAHTNLNGYLEPKTNFQCWFINQL